VQQHSQDLDRADHTWLANLVRELFQTEESAKHHPLAEAERLGEVPPAEALRAVAVHARRTLAELPPLVRGHDLPVSDGGRTVGAAFSAIRERVADLMLTAERSYRGTLLGMHHGIDLVILIQSLARMEGDVELASWCEQWLERRRPLVEAAVQELAWFAANPARAREPATDNPLALGLQALVSGFEQFGARLRQVFLH